MARRGIILFTALWLSGCQLSAGVDTDLQVPANGLDFCQVISDPQQYVGKEVVVNAIYKDTPHRELIYGSGCPKRYVYINGSSARRDNRSARSTLWRAVRKNPTAEVRVLLRGVLQERPDITPCLREACMRYELDEAQLIVAQYP